jgi:hypothetical protein
MQEYCIMRGIRAPCYEEHKMKYPSVYPITQCFMEKNTKKTFELKHKYENDMSNDLEIAEQFDSEISLKWGHDGMEIV